ncbi:MAG: putative baseplate assembly protein [Anaerolineae bacterium]|nr:putative baseplate assembly protein [Anaerolineae bacterium]
MPLPEPRLDDLRFQQDLVDEARRRIIRYCPEWTDYNLSDPGITLIELFAWMTELLTFRLNRVPEKNYLKFLDLLGVQLQPPSSARTELTFWLSTPFPITPDSTSVAVVPQGAEVAGQRLDGAPEVIFTTDTRMLIQPPRLTQLRRAGDINKNYLPRLGVEVFEVFQTKPEIGDTFYIGLDEDTDISGYILQLSFTCQQTQAVGIRREDPPLMWEASLGEGNWSEVRPSRRRGEQDTTGGLNNPSGRLTLYLPLNMQPDEVQGRRAYWIRCRHEQRSPEQGTYAQSPRITGVVAYALGGAVYATHAVIREDERLGISNGEPGQVFKLQTAPVLALRNDETIVVEERRQGEVGFVPWECVDDFAGSTRYDRHFTLDNATGEITFGPSVQQADGTVRQYGRVPEAGREIRFTRYRNGGGAVGNVPTHKLEVLHTSLPYIDRVTNLKRAEGGRNQETLDEAKLRARREMRAQQRAVTTEDFESLALRASRAVARVKCRTAGYTGRDIPAGMIELLVVPTALEAIHAGDLSKLALETALREVILAYLDQYRLLTTTLNVREPHFLGVSVTAQIVPGEFSHPETVRARVDAQLRAFLAPLVDKEQAAVFSDLTGQTWEGWPFGRDLFVSELFSLIQQVPGVRHVLDVQLRSRPVIPVQESGEHREEALASLESRILNVPDDTLICSLPHSVEVVTL